MKLESTTGVLFLAAVIKEKSPLSFMGSFRLTRNHFDTVELRVIDLLQNYIDLYKQIPDKNFVEVELGAEIPDPPTSGSVSFWADEVRKRYAVENSYTMCRDILAKITDGDIDSAADASSRMTRILIEGQTKTRVYALEDAYDGILEAHNNARLNMRIQGVPFGIEFLDKCSGGAQGGDLLTIAGRPGCLAGDTVIRIQRGDRNNYRNYSIKDAYYRFNGHTQECVAKGVNQRWRSGKNIKTFTLSCDANGKVAKNEIKNITYSGVQEVYKVMTVNGLCIKTTAEHKFLVGEGNYKELKYLSSGDSVQIYSGKVKTNHTKKSRLYRPAVNGLKFHPSAYTHTVDGKKYKKYPLSRLVIEAELNKVTLDFFIAALRESESISKEFTFLGSSLQVHHVDGNSKNNSLENLMVMTADEHSRLHGLTTAYDINGISGIFDKIVSIELVGEEETYDIEMAGGPHNFIANNFFVHNSSKTFLLLHMALSAYESGKNVMLIPTEMSEIQYHRRIAALRNNLSINSIKFGELSSIIGTRLLEYDKELISKNEHKFYMTDASMSLGMLDVKSAAYVYKPDAIYIDGAYLLRPETYAKSRYEMVSSVAESLKMLAKEMNIPIFATYQINKKTDDIYQSDVVRQLSSIVIELSDYDEGTEVWGQVVKPKLLNITKGRDGESGSTIILLDTIRTRIVEQDRDYDLGVTDEGDRRNSTLEVDGV